MKTGFIERAISYCKRNSRKISIVLFLFWLSGLYFYFEYDQRTGQKPQSFHQWRQSDCASFALQYYHNGMHFFEPRLHNVLEGNGNCAGECPLIYYFVAGLYKVFGVHEIIFKIVNLVFLLLGLVSLYLLTRKITGDFFFAHVIPLLFFSSPVIMFFGNSFLDDVPAISCVFAALYFIFLYKDSGNIPHFMIAMFCFCLAALLKLNSAIPLVAVAALFFLELNSWVKLNGDKKLFIHPFINIAGFCLAAIVIIAWYRYAIHYNEKYGVVFFTTGPWPGWTIWEVSDYDFVNTLTKNIAALRQLFDLLVCALIFFLIGFILFNRQFLSPLLNGIFILCLTGSLLFYFTFFVNFKENEYYFVNLMMVPVFAFLCSAVIIKKKYPFVFQSIVFRLLILPFLILNIYNAKSMLDVYSHRGRLDWRQNENFYRDDFRAFIDSIGIGKTDRIISMPDVNPNTTLYLIDRTGWSNFNLRRDSISFEKAIDSGAKYFVVSDPVILQDSVLRMFAKHYTGNFRDIYVYKLLKEKRSPLRNDKICILAANGKYVSLNSDSELVADKGSAGSNELFQWIDIGNNCFYLTTFDGNHISADLDHNGLLHSPRAWVGIWEIFSKEQIDSLHFAIKAYNGKYIRVNSQGHYELIADKSDVKDAEVFSFIKQ